MAKRWIVPLLVVGLFAALLAPQPVDAGAQAAGLDISINGGPVYLGPAVVISGQASDPIGVDAVSITIENTDTGEYVQSPAGTLGPSPVALSATTALLPPLGDPAVSWRVPLTLLAGNYLVDATAIAGAASTSVSSTFEVVAAADPPVTLVAFGSTWSYFDLGAEPAPNGGPPLPWYSPTYDDGGWATGPAELGYGDGDEATTTAATDGGGQPVTTTYFRHAFSFASGDFGSIGLSIKRDDGAIIYLNGAELARTNMAPGPVGYSTFASSVSEQTVSVTLDPNDLVDGQNLLAVEIHQANATSSDISFDLELIAQPSVVPLVSNNQPGTYVLTAGDMARCSFDGDEAVAAQMADLFDSDAGVFIGLGDLAYNSGTIDEFTNCYDPTIGQFKDVTWPSAGNHEHYTAPNAAGYRAYFGPAAGPFAGPTGGLWYSFDIDDNWHVIALDSDCQGREVLPGAVGGDGCAVGSDQEVWLRADLAANADKNVIAFFHHPPFTNNQYTDHTYTWPLWRALAEYGADITLHGHEHHYERYTPLDYWGDPQGGGLREFIIGSGGTFPRYDIRPQEPESDFRGTFPPGTNDFGVLQLWLRADGYDWLWEPINGLAATDSGSSGLAQPMARAEIAGTIDNADDGPLPAIEVCATAARTAVETCTITDAAGEYALGPLVADSYTIAAAVGSATYEPGSDTVVLTPPANGALDLSLEAIPGAIQGMVTDGVSGSALVGIDVCADGGSLAFPTCRVTAAGGLYELEDLPSGSYQVSFSDPGGLYLPQCYDAASCASPTLVSVIAPSVRTAIDAALDPVPTPTPTPTPVPSPTPTATPTPVATPTPTTGGTITGTITTMADGVAIFGARVCAVRSLPAGEWCTTTDGSGRFTLSGLPTANYTLQVDDPVQRFVPNCWGAQPCAAAEIFGLAGTTAVRDAVLDPNYSNTDPQPTPAPDAGGQGTIAGTVTRADQRTAGIEVCAVSVNGGAPACVDTDAAGEYTIGGLATGNYRVSFDGDAACYRSKAGCSTFTPVGVVSPSGRVGIDGSL